MTRNPFRLRLAEQIESDDTFLRLFSPAALDPLRANMEWGKAQVIRSSPGGGKTSLFRVLTPRNLTVLHRARTNDAYIELYRQLIEMGAMDEQGPRVLGVVVSCARNYASLQDLPLSTLQTRRLFFGLLNARIMLACLRAALEMRGLRYPDDLERVVLGTVTEGSPTTQIPIQADGTEVFEWAGGIEETLSDIIDSFGQPEIQNVVSHDTLYALTALGDDSILVDGEPICSRVLVMFDDVHRLTTDQRRALVSAVYELRPRTSVWLAERLEALSPSELLSPGAIEGREYGTPLVLENFWRGPRQKSLQSFLSNIADRRVQAADGVHLASFHPCVGEYADQGELVDYTSISERVAGRIADRFGGQPRYAEWIEGSRAQERAGRERAIHWRSLEILIERDSRRSQLSLDSLAPLPVDDLSPDASVRAAADFFLAEEFKIPYYYGLSQLVAASSSNVEQFLDLASRIFEESASAEIIGADVLVPPRRQEALLFRAAKRRWDSIPRLVPNGGDVQSLLAAVGRMARRETLRPNAPYAPGVTGIGLRTADRERVKDPEASKKEGLARLRYALAACLSHNLLDASMNRSQGKRGQTWTVLYLNRWLCLHFGLPLGYGGWRPKKLAELDEWVREEGNLPLEFEGSQ